MKSLKRILAVILTIATVCAFSTVAFAADLGTSSYKVELVPSKTTVAPGETFTVAVYLLDAENENENITFVAGPMAALELHYTGIVGARTADDVAIPDGANKTSMAFADTYVNIFYDHEADMIVGKDIPYAVVTFVAGEEDITFSVVDGGLNDYNGGYAEADTSATATVTVKAAQAEEEVVDATKISEGTETIFGKENSYWGVWVGTYSVTPGAKSIKKATVSFAEAGKTFETGAIAADGPGAVEFKVAIVGVPAEYATGSAATVTLQ